MATNDYDADRTDMVEYMSEASDNGEWHRPSLKPVDGETYAAVAENTPTTLLYCLDIGGATIDAHRIDDTTDVIHRRTEDERGRSMHRIAFFGEASMDVRYWLLQAEINDVPLTIDYVAADVVDDIAVGMSPPEWEDQIRALLDRYGEATDDGRANAQGVNTRDNA